VKRPATWTPTWRLIAFHPVSYAGMTLLYLASYATQVLPGLILQRVFDRLSGAAPAGTNLWTLIALLAGAQVAHLTSTLVQTIPEERFRCYGWALLRGNIVRNALRRPGARRLNVAPGDAVNRLHADVSELADWPSWLPYLSGQFLMVAIAIVTMVRVSPQLTLIAALPLGIVVATVRIARGHLLRYQQQGLEAGSRVTGFLGEVLDAVAAVKGGTAERTIVRHLETLNTDRRQAEVRFTVLLALLNWAHTSVAEVVLGILLLVAAGLLRQGDLTVGGLVLFVTYLRLIVDVPAGMGGFFADYETQAVSIDRLQELQPGAAPESLVAPLPVYLWQPQPDPHSVLPPRQALTSLRATGLTYHYSSGDAGAADGRTDGIESVDLEVRHGEFVVVTGRIGAGKTTLLRVLLGLLPADSGEIMLNGKIVTQPDRVLVPPTCGYTPQVPRLFSASLRENLLLGFACTDEELSRALHLAVLAPDIAELPEGLDTQVGPRGRRLSGGQVQRAAAARMLARRPGLIVVDDISSALDVETEEKLWQRVLAQPEITCLAVSHRRPVLQRADRIIVLKEGCVQATGELEQLLANSDECRAIWRGQV